MPLRSRKVLKSRILGSDRDNIDDAVTLSNSPKEMAAKIRGKKIRKQKLDKLDKLNESIESTRVVFTVCPSHLAYEDLQNKDVDEIMAVSEGWLNDMEMARFRSKKINGKFSGVLKDRIVCLQSIIKALIERIKDTGDVTYLRRRNDELASQLRESRKEELRLQAIIKEADKKMEKLSLEISDLKKKVNLKHIDTEIVRTPPPLPPSSTARGRLDTPRASTSKKDTPRKRDNVRTASVAESLRDCDEQLVAITKCDEKIAKFEELLKQMRLDLYGSLETISEKVSNSVNATNIINKKKGVPKIISNIQLVFPRAMHHEAPTVEESDYHSEGEGWLEVKNRRGRKSVKIDTSNNELVEMPMPAVSDNRNRNSRRPPLVAPVTRRRPPRVAAVSIKANTENITYADIIKRAGENVNLNDLGIVNPRMRRAANGGIIIEIAGPEGTLKADSLASRLREVIGSSASVSRPVVRADVRISGFDDLVIKDELITIITWLATYVSGSFVLCVMA